MERRIIDNKEFLLFKEGNIEIGFSTALNQVNYKKELEEGKKNLESLKEIFKVSKIIYVNQTHSNNFVDATFKEFKGDIDCDSIITKEKNTLIGVFTADCVPVIAYDGEKGVISAIHSGWKGTYYEIVKRTVEYMKKEYNCEDIKILIGSHIRECCYEVSYDLANKFKEKFGEEVVKNRNLSLEKCVKIQLKNLVKEENIKSLCLCTYCEKDIKMHSYRDKKEEAGRLFSFAYIR